MARRSLRIEAKRQDRMKPGSVRDNEFSFSEQSSEDLSTMESFSNKGNYENYAIRIQLGGKVKPYAVKRSQMKSLRKSKLKLPSRKIPKGSQDTISQMELSEHENREDPNNLPALIVTELSSASKTKEYVLPNTMSISIGNEDSAKKELRENDKLINSLPQFKVQNQEIVSGMRDKGFDWKEIRDGSCEPNVGQEHSGKATNVRAKDESEDKVVRDLQEFLQLGGERRLPLKPLDNCQENGTRIGVQVSKKVAQGPPAKQYREPPPVIIVKKVPEGKEKAERVVEEPLKKVPDVTKSAKQITGKERDTYLRDMKDSILRDLNPLVLKSLVNRRCGETHVDFSSHKYYDSEFGQTNQNWSKYLAAPSRDPLWSETDKYKFKSVFKDIKSSIESFEGASGSANESNKFDINEMEMNKAPKRMYRKKMGDEKLEAWYQYNLYKSLQLPEEAKRKAEAEAWLKTSSAASISHDMRSQDSANIAFIDSRSLDSVTSDYSFEASEILGSSTPINPMLVHTKHFSKHYASFNTSEQ